MASPTNTGAGMQDMLAGVQGTDRWKNMQNAYQGFAANRGASDPASVANWNAMMGKTGTPPTINAGPAPAATTPPAPTTGVAPVGTTPTSTDTLFGNSYMPAQPSAGSMTGAAVAPTPPPPAPVAATPTPKKPTTPAKSTTLSAAEIEQLRRQLAIAAMPQTLSAAQQQNRNNKRGGSNKGSAGYTSSAPSSGGGRLA